jgi:hypothetical protein
MLSYFVLDPKIYDGSRLGRLSVYFFFKKCEGRLLTRMTTLAVLVLVTFEKTVAGCIEAVVPVFLDSITFSVWVMNASD